MIVNNPTDKEISVVIKGVTYTVEASGQLPGVPEEVAKNWKERTHNFIILNEEGEVSKEMEKVEKEVEKVLEEKEVVKEKVEDKKSTKSKK